MSLRATLWAYDDAPVEKATETLVLIALADEANDQGRNAFPSVAKIAARARCKSRAAKYALRALEDAGLIVRGDQSIAARHIARSDRRPIVYDLVMTVTWESVGKPRPGSGERGAPDAPRSERGAPEGTNGVHADVERGAPEGTNGVHAGAPDPTTPNPTHDPKIDPTPSSLRSEGPDEDSGDTVTAKGTRLSADWQPSERLKDWFRGDASLHSRVNPIEETARFVDYWIAVPGARGTKRNWDATWRNWIRRAAQGPAGRTAAAPQHPDSSPQHVASRSALF